MVCFNSRDLAGIFEPIEALAESLKVVLIAEAILGLGKMQTWIGNTFQRFSVMSSMISCS